MNKIRVAYIGLGWIADWHFKAMKRVSSIEVVGACDAPENYEACRARCNEWGIKGWRSYEEVLGDPGVDAVAILTPTWLHTEQTLAALRAKKHVLVEKPVALSAEEIGRMEQAAKAAGVVVMPGHNFVYRPVVRKAKEVLASGMLGNVSYASFRAVHFIPEVSSAGWRKSLNASGGGAMIDSGTHLVYQSLYLMGRPSYLFSFDAKKHYLELESEDISLIGLQYPDGAIGNILQSWASGDPSAGEVRIEGDKANLLIADGLYVDGKKMETDFEYGDSFYHLAQAFSDAALKGTKPISTLEDARAALILIQNAYASAKEKRVIHNPAG